MANILTDCVRKDGEYSQLLAAVTSAKTARTPLPILLAGLCDGAADAVTVSLIEDLKKTDKRPTLLICPEEKECVRLTRLLEQFGLRSAFYVGRDLTFYHITASHEYEHERLRVLSELLEDSLDVVVTTPDAALSYTIPADRLIAERMRIEYGKTTIEPSELATRLWKRATFPLSSSMLRGSLRCAAVSWTSILRSQAFSISTDSER